MSKITILLAVQEYLHKEVQLCDMLGPTNLVNSKYFHRSPMSTRPKDLDRRRVILNLSHPYGGSVNDQVSKLHFDNRRFTLKFPSIDHIVDKILNTEDPLIYKIDVARAFRNLRVDPVDLKFGIYWDNRFYLDQSDTFGWIYLFIYLGFYVAFNTVQVISQRVVGRAEETSTYSSSGFCTVNCRPTASNYQLSHLRPCRELNPSLRGGRRECYHSATVAPDIWLEAQ